MKLVSRTRGPKHKVPVRQLALALPPLLSAFAKDHWELIFTSFQNPTPEFSLPRESVLDLREDSKVIQLRHVADHALRINCLLAMLRVLARKLGLGGRAMETYDNIAGERYLLRFLHLEHVANETRTGFVWRPIIDAQIPFQVLVAHDAGGRPMPFDSIPILTVEECSGIGHQQRLRKVDVLPLLQLCAQILGSYLFHGNLLRLQLRH
mmetsp:Transcript_29712/g.74649  ORF Transcript_29712/g.74649 Transcript_29712/m.74649 type:complete len:208 (-) Transcript_29712:418-1041(-)